MLILVGAKRVCICSRKRSVEIYFAYATGYLSPDRRFNLPPCHQLRKPKKEEEKEDNHSS
jgi:hypothetical protein